MSDAASALDAVVRSRESDVDSLDVDSTARGAVSRVVLARWRLSCAALLAVAEAAPSEA